MADYFTDYGFGPRWTEQTQSASGPPKGLGHLGLLKTPDGGVMSEFSQDGEINGVPVQYPLIVPTLTKDEVLGLVNHERVTPEIEAKARAFALQRLQAGKSPFASPGEQRMQYPDIPRQRVPLPTMEPPTPLVDTLRNNWSIRPTEPVNLGGSLHALGQMPVKK
jgi:hypothetical protein